MGRLVALIHVKFGTAEGTCARDTSNCLDVQNFTPVDALGLERGPKMAKISTFWYKVAYSGEPYDRLLQLLGSFIRPTILH